MLQGPNLGHHQLAPWTPTSLSVNVSGTASHLNGTGIFLNNMTDKDGVPDGNNRSSHLGVTSLLMSQLIQTTPPLSGDHSKILIQPETIDKNDSSVIIKISLLLVVTAFVLMASYKFVVHLFIGYSDRKDDAFSDSCSEDEDSTGMKKHYGPILEIG